MSEVDAIRVPDLVPNSLQAILDLIDIRIMKRTEELKSMVESAKELENLKERRNHIAYAINNIKEANDFDIEETSEEVPIWG